GPQPNCGPLCAPRVAGGGACVGSPKCSAATCFGGCCAGDVCMLGNDPSACGARGRACQVCAPGQSCIENGQLGCQFPPFCTVQNCQTCCLGNQCLPGNVDTACGEQSEQCIDCTPQGGVCSFHQCVNGCSGRRAPVAAPARCARSATRTSRAA